MIREMLEAAVPEALAGKRLDQALAELFSDYSRSRLQKWVKAGKVTVNGGSMAVKEKVAAGDRIELHPEEVPVIEDAPERIDLDIVHEDDDLLVINKRAGLVVHPAAGNPSGTLLNGLLHHDPSLETLPRAGIVHRLDKETSGLLVVARSQRAHKYLIEMLQKREIHREYRTVVCGLMVAGGTVDEPIGRHPTQRTKMAIVYNESAKPAMTDYRVLERFRGHCLLQVKLHSGRTHQIRVHMAHIRHPVVGDPLYGGRLQIPSGSSEELREMLRGFKRQALHAFKLGFEHPGSGEWVEWESPLPHDMEHLLTVLRADAANA